MSAIDHFSNAATAAGATVHVVAREDATAVLEDITQEPAVGVPLEIDGVSLPAAVETDPGEETLQSARTGITAAPLGIEPLGSVFVPSDEHGTGPVSLFPERQIAVIERENIVGDVESAFAAIGERYRSDGDGNGDVNGNGNRKSNDGVLVTGPSSTGDMGDLVTGVHGPAELHVVVIDDE